MAALRAIDHQALDDLELAVLTRQGDASAARVLTTRNNQRLYRTAFSILKDRAEAEEAVQEAYLKAFAALDSFQGHSAFSTWLTRIAVNEALGRRRSRERRRRRLEDHGVSLIEDYQEALMPDARHDVGAEEELMRRQMAGILEGAIARLPEPFRTVFVLREDLGPQLKSSLAETFVFCGADCAALTEKVLERLGLK